MKLKKIAIIGLGSIGRRHLRLMRKVSVNTEIVLVRSGIGKKWPEEKLATEVVTSIQDAIAMNIQAAIISSPTKLHVKQAEQLINSGVHLLIEKPLSDSMERVKELQELAATNNCIVLVGYVLRFDLAAREFKQLLEKNMLGKFLHARIECGSYLPDWRPEQDYRTTASALKDLGGGVLLELSHELDYLYWFFGRPVSVYGTLRNSFELEINVEDQADLIVTSKAGYPIIVQMDFNRRFPKRICNVQTTKGELTWDAIQKTTKWKPVNGNELVEKFEFERDYIYEEQLKNFISSIEGVSEPTVSLQDGINVMELIHAIRVSNETGKRVTV